MTAATRSRTARALLVGALLAVVLASTPASAAPTSEVLTSAVDIGELSRIAVGYTHACGIDDARDLYCWGDNDEGQLGLGTKATSLLARPVVTTGTPLAGKDIERVAAGFKFSCALTTDDLIACWGDNQYGQLGDGTTTDSLVPVVVAEAGSVLDGADIVELSTLHLHICARTAAGAAACWGLGNLGQLGTGAVGNQETPTNVDTTGTPLAGTAITQVSVGSFNSCFVGANGAVACSGTTTRGALGNASATAALKPESPTTAGTVLAGKSVDHVTAGRYSACVTTTDDVLACWGIGDDGQMGDGDTTDNLVPGPVTTAGTPLASSPAVSLDSGWDHHCARTAAGGLVCWGDNTYRSAGGSTSADSVVPNAIPVAGTVLDGVAVTDLSSGAFGNCAVGASKQPGCWGPYTTRGDAVAAYTPSPATVILSYGPPPQAPTIAELTGEQAQVVVSWAAPSDTGGIPLTAMVFRIYQSGNLVSTIEVGASGTSGVAFLSVDPGTYTVTAAAKNAEGEGPASAPYGPVTALEPEPDPTPYVPITPCRIVDTRVVGGRLGDREIRDIQVTGDGSVFAAQGGKANGCGIPAGATAVEASITAVDPLDSGFFRAWPTGESMPNATFMNFDRGMDITNTGSVTIAPSGQLRIRNFGGSSQYVIDIQGYFADGGAMASASPDATTSAVAVDTLYEAITPCRILDTRVVGGTLANREIRDVAVVGSGPAFAAQGGKANGCGIPADAVAVEASITAVDPADSGFFRAWPNGQSMPNATFMNFDRGMDITNTGAITIDVNDPNLRIRNFGGSSHYVIDIQGYFVEPRLT
ncbi:MAG: hypothetical protein R2701_03700 [Acidimicrobiales bacterium]